MANGKHNGDNMEKDADRLSILEKIERGEISIEEAEVELGQILEPEASIVPSEAKEEIEVEELEDEEEGEEPDAEGEAAKEPDAGDAE